MINALSAGISGREPGVPAEVLRSYCGGDSVTQYIYTVEQLGENNSIKIENHDRLAFCRHVCSCAARDRLG